MGWIGLIIWLIVFIIVACAVVGVVRAALGTPFFAFLGPYSNLIYALVVLLVVLLGVSLLYGDVLPAPGILRRPS